MKQYSAEEIDHFLKYIETYLDGYPKEVATRFKERIKKPKNKREADTAGLLFALADNNALFTISSASDGIIDEKERDMIKQDYPVSFKASMKSMLISIEKEMAAEKEKNIPKSQKRSFWHKVVDFIKSPKTLMAASVIVPTGSAAENEKSNIESDKQQVEIFYSPQSFDEALSDLTEIVMKKKSQVNKTEEKAPVKEKPASFKSFEDNQR